MSQSHEERRAFAADLACGTVAGFVCVALFNAVAFAVAVPLGSGGLGLRAIAELFAGAETLGVGALFAGAMFAWLWFVPAPLWVGAAIAGALGALALIPVASVEIYRQACVTVDAEWAESALYVAYQVGNGLSFPVAIFLGVFLSRYRRLFVIPLVLALAIAVANQIVQRDDYVSVHATVSFAMGLLIGGALGPRARRAFDHFRATSSGRVGLAALGAVAAFGVAVPPSNAVRCEMFRDYSTFAPWMLATTIWRAPSPRAGTVAPNSPWYAKREGQPDTPPTSPLLLAKAPLVVMITIDATRGEAINDPDKAEMFPTITRLKSQGFTFMNASSPASQTALSLSTTFSGKLYSSMQWAYWGKGVTRFHYPHSDPTTRFPELLSRNGVDTAAVSSVIFIDNDFGIFRGFKTERMTVKGREHAYARAVIDQALDLLKNAGQGPMLLYMHLMEPHAPYDRGKRTGTDYERYLSEISVADRELSRLIRVVDQQFADRAVVILGADHGEAFGEHETTQHSKTLYEEMIHIPLVIRTPELRGRVIETRVGLLDVGPTILDIFGVPIPSQFIGQSLVPILEHKRMEFQRPLIAEGRLRHAITMPDGLKVIDDPRRKLVEVYDLQDDPEEMYNLWGQDERADDALIRLRTFYANNAYTEGGYSPPYKP